jgi:hypothetical protein
MPGKSRKVVFWFLVAKIVQQEKRIEVLGLAEAEGTLQLHARTFDRGRGLNNLFNWSE